MKINAVRLFDLALLGAAKAAVELKPFLEYVNSTNDQLIRALRGELTLGDNVKGTEVTLELQHGVALAVATTTRPRGVTLLQCASTDGDTVTSFDWRYDDQGRLQLTCYFRLASTTRHKVRFFLFG